MVDKNLVPISYNKLWKLLIDKQMNKTDLKNLANVSSNVIASMGRDEPVAMVSLVKICTALGVDIGDVVSVSGVEGKSV